MIKLLQLHAVKFIYFLLLLIVFSEAVLRKKYCEVDGKYKVCFMEQEEICHPLNKSTGLKIERLENSAIIVKPFSRIHYGNELSADKQCRFTIKVKNDGEGLFAVIQNINFRRNADRCVDYVKFKSKDKDQWSKEWCGSMDRNTSESEMEHYLYSEYDPKGKIDTHIFISSDSTKQAEGLSLSIIYTPNIKCSRVDRKNYRQVTPEICIWKDYICDGYQNCAIHGCDDEKECVRSLENSDTGTKVTVGAVTTIFLCFILFVTCLWICKKHKKLCWSSDCAGPGVTRPSSNGDMERVTTASAPTAPMLEIAVPSGVQDKDLPPSYDSLFPEQSNTTTS